MNKKLEKTGYLIYHIESSNIMWSDIDFNTIINNLSYDDILDFAEYVEESILSTPLQKSQCDTILRIEGIDRYTKKSIIFNIVKGRDLVRKHYNKNEVKPKYQEEW